MKFIILTVLLNLSQIKNVDSNNFDTENVIIKGNKVVSIGPEENVISKVDSKGRKYKFRICKIQVLKRNYVQLYDVYGSCSNVVDKVNKSLDK